MSADHLDAALKALTENLSKADDATLRRYASNPRKRQEIERLVALVALVLSQRPERRQGDPMDAQGEAIASAYSVFHDRLKRALEATAGSIRA